MVLIKTYAKLGVACLLKYQTSMAYMLCTGKYLRLTGNGYTEAQFAEILDLGPYHRHYFNKYELEAIKAKFARLYYNEPMA